jgi:hypothetical protein
MRETWRNLIDDIEEYWVQVLNPYSLQVHTHTCWMLGFVTNPKTSPK